VTALLFWFNNCKLFVDKSLVIIMPTLLKIANYLAKTFVDANDKKYVAKHITNEINCLIYAATKRPVEYRIKILIIQVIVELINGEGQ